VSLLPTSGVLKLSDIIAEFGGGTPPANLRAYLRSLDSGSGYVMGVGDKPDYAPNVPSSEPIAIRDFLGAGKNPLSCSLSTSGVEGAWPTPPMGPGPAATPWVTASATGGSGTYTYMWWESSLVSEGISITHPTWSHTRFSKWVTEDDAFYGEFQCTITDTAFPYWQITTGVVTVLCFAGEAASFYVTLSSSTAYGSTVAPATATSNSITSSVTGGAGSNSYSWAKLSGTPSFTITSPTSSSTTFSQYYSAAGSGYATYRLTVTDAYSATCTADVVVTLEASESGGGGGGGGGLSAEASTTYAYGNGSGMGTQDVYSAGVTISVTGGTSPYYVSWAKLSGDDMELGGDGSTYVEFYRSVGEMETAGAVYRCSVTDSASGGPITIDVTVYLENYG